jgi:hypothetical protein
MRRHPFLVQGRVRGKHRQELFLRGLRRARVDVEERGDRNDR